MAVLNQEEARKKFMNQEFTNFLTNEKESPFLDKEAPKKDNAIYKKVILSFVATTIVSVFLYKTFGS